MLIFYDGYQITTERSEYDPDETWYGYVSLQTYPDFHFWDCTTETASLEECITATIKKCDWNSQWYGFKPDLLIPDESWMATKLSNDDF